MEVTFESILYYVVLLDAIAANLMAWSGYGAQLNQKHTLLRRILPITKGWTTYYLILTLWLGVCLARLGLLFTW